MSAARETKALTVTQVRSGIGYSRRQNATLRALGLTKIGRVRVYRDTPQVRGMLARVSHLVSVSRGSGGQAAAEEEEEGTR